MMTHAWRPKQIVAETDEAVRQSPLKVTPTGLEQGSESTRKTQLSESGGAESGALLTDCTWIDTDLQRIIDAWGTLPEHLKRAMIAMLG
jgi:hypothetical protein